MHIIGAPRHFALAFMWLIEGIVVGFGAILPGISGGTLCAAFGMYRPAIETFTNAKVGLKKYGLMLGIFIIGTAAGFFGLSGFAAFLMDKSSTFVTCAFIGFIFGTFPELWRDAGTSGRTSKSYYSLVAGLSIMIFVLYILKIKVQISLSADILGFFICGLLWGLSFIIPGLSSSSLLMFFGLYKPMLKGIFGLDYTVLIPMGLGFILCVLLLSKAISFLYKRYYSNVSHAVIGIVAATAIMIIPDCKSNAETSLLCVLIILIGAAVSYGFSTICRKIRTSK